MTLRIGAAFVGVVGLLGLGCAESSAPKHVEVPSGGGEVRDSGSTAEKIAEARGKKLAPEDIQRVIRADNRGMQACYEQGVLRNATLKGRISTRIVIEGDGTVSSAMDAHDAPPPAQLEHAAGGSQPGPRFPDPKVVACVVARFKALKFPSSEAGSSTVIYPLVFEPGE